MDSQKAEVEKLLSEGMPFVEKMLQQHGEFHPFGVVTRSGGEIVHFGAWIGEEFPPAERLVEALVNAMRSQSSELSSSAIFRNVSVREATQGEPIDAIEAGLEHSKGYSVNVFFPYRRGSDGQLQVGDPFACARDPQIFSA